MNRWGLPFLLISSLLSCLNLHAAGPRQLSQRQLDSDSTSKFLTLGEVDSWTLEAKANEVLIVHVTTSQFDSVVGLARSNGEDSNDEVLFSVDEVGSNGHFYHRILEAGTYKIRVHGYQMKGGGNYQMSVKRFVAQPAEIGTKVTGRFDEKGRASVFFDATPNQQLVLNGGPFDNVFDHDGQPVHLDWMSTLLVKTEGEHLVSLTGSPNCKFEFCAAPAVIKKLSVNEPDTVDAARDQLNIWEIDVQPDQFRVISVSRAGNPHVRLIPAPDVNKKDKPLSHRKSRTPLRLLPVASKGDSTKYAVVFGVTGKFQLQTYSNSDAAIDVQMIDPTTPAKRNLSATGKLKLGDAMYYGFKANAGEVITMNVESETFDSVLRLVGPTGRIITENDDFRDSRNSQITHLITRKGYYRWQIASLGNGGGGQFKIGFTEIEKQELDIGRSQESKIAADTTQYWNLESDEKKSVFVQIRSQSGDAQIQVFDSDGRSVGTQVTTSSKSGLVPIRLSEDDPMTVWVTSRNGGRYDIRVMDADW